MGSTIVSVTSVARNLSEYLNRVAYRGEVVVLRRGGQLLAELRPLPSGRRLGDLPGMIQGLPPLAEGDADAFASDISAIKKDDSVEKRGLRDPWA